MLLGFLLGIIAGLLIGVILLLFDIRKERNLVEKVSKRLQDIKKPSGAILEPLGEVEEAQRAVLDFNEKRGKDTNLEELGL